MTEPLSHDDFGIEDGKKLRLLRRGVFAVLFMAKDDKASMQLVRIMKNLQIPGMATGYLDITRGKNRDVIALSRRTTSQINSLPYLGIFCEGKLKCRYKGAVNREKLRNYCQTKVIDFSTKAQTHRTGPIRQDGGGSINRTVKADQFSLARSNGDASKGGGPHPVKAGMVGLNRAWLLDGK